MVPLSWWQYWRGCIKSESILVNWGGGSTCPQCGDLRGELVTIFVVLARLRLFSIWSLVSWMSVLLKLGHMQQSDIWNHGQFRCYLNVFFTWNHLTSRRYGTNSQYTLFTQIIFTNVAVYYYIDTWIIITIKGYRHTWGGAWHGLHTVRPPEVRVSCIWLGGRIYRKKHVHINYVLHTLIRHLHKDQSVHVY